MASQLSQTMGKDVHSSLPSTVIVQPTGHPALPGTHLTASCLRLLASDYSLCVDHSSVWLITHITQVFAQSHPLEEVVSGNTNVAPLSPFPYLVYFSS